MICHTDYQIRGGEDANVEAFGKLLAEDGVECDWLRYKSADWDGLSLGRRLRLAGGVLRSTATADDILRRHAERRYDGVLFGNMLPFMSYDTVSRLARAALKCVVIAQNYRPFCVNGLLLRDGVECRLCLSGSRASAVRHRCYRDSLPQSLLVAGASALQDVRGVFQRDVSGWIVLSGFQEEVFRSRGIEASRLAVVPGPIEEDAPVAPAATSPRGEYCLFAGRLSREKGAAWLVSEWPEHAPTLVVAGDGPERGELEALVKGRALGNVEFLGRLSYEALSASYRGALAVVIPSLFPETQCRIVGEAYAHGRPVLAARVGALTDSVSHGRTGLLVEPARQGALTAALPELLGLARDPETAVRCRDEWRRRFSPAVVRGRLRGIVDRFLGGGA